MRPILEKALHKRDGLPLTSHGAPLNANDGVVGTWTLDNALKLAVDVVSDAAQHTGSFMSFDQLQKHLNAKDQKIIQPNFEDPIFDPPHLSYDTPEDREIAKSYRYHQALRTYEVAHRTHQIETAKTDQIRRLFGYGLGNYLGYADAEISRLTQSSENNDQAQTPLSAFLSQKRSLPIPEAAAEYGTFIVGNHGSGKSEVIKQRVWHYLNKPDVRETIIVIDPHGELAPEIARMKPLYDNDRLVYIDPMLDPAFTPCPNLLNTKDKSSDNLFVEASLYGEALRAISGTADPTGTGNMETICQNCAHVVLENDNYNLKDLMDLLSVEPPKRDKPDKAYPQIYEDACHKSPNPIIQEHFQNIFMHGNYGMAKNAMFGRLERIITSPVLQRMLLNPPTFNVGELLEQRKVIVINLPFKDLTEPVTRMIGQLLMAQITMAILKRKFGQSDGQHPVHVFIDEAQHLVTFETAKQINELRKFGFNLTLATQYTEQFPSKTLEAVKGLGIQIAGFCTGKNLETMNATFELTTKSKDLDETTVLQNQTVGNFYLRARGAEGAPPILPRQFQVDTNLLFKGAKWREQNAARYMTDAEWAVTKQQQLETYYCPTSDLGQRRSDANARQAVGQAEPSSKSRTQAASQTPSQTKLDPGAGYD